MDICWNVANGFCCLITTTFEVCVTLRPDGIWLELNDAIEAVNSALGCETPPLWQGMTESGSLPQACVHATVSSGRIPRVLAERVFKYHRVSSCIPCTSVPQSVTPPQAVLYASHRLCRKSLIKAARLLHVSASAYEAALRPQLHASDMPTWQ